MSTPPNIVVILADDLGFSDIACYGGEIPTPNLDRLAERGVRMSSFYVTPRCSPTRASMLTGRYNHEVGVGVLTRPVGYRGSLDPHVPTSASLLAEHGYATSHTGKWHLASDMRTPSESWPTRRGFEDFYGILTGSTSYFWPQTLHTGEDPVSVSANEEYYATDAFTTHALEFIRAAQAADRPFFLSLSYTAPHWPLQARPEEIAAEKGRYDEGWDAIRDARHQRQAQLGLFPSPVEKSPRDPNEVAWRDSSDHDWQCRRMEVYAAQVRAMDRGIGVLLDHLDSSNAAEDTIVMFLSDNGAESSELPPGRRLSPSVEPPSTRAGGEIAIGNDPSIQPGGEDTFSSYGRAWANLSNTPFRFYKKWVHEGGIAAPLIVSWPNGGVPAGGIDHTPHHVIDIMPTMLEAAGISPPEDVSGRSFLDAVRGREAPERTLFWEHIGNAAVRNGRYKLVREVDQPWELYDLANDRTELNDLARIHPDFVADLAAQWEEWADAHGVISWDEYRRIFAAQGLPAWQLNS